MCHYKHLALEEREKLLYFSAKGYSVTKIAEELKRNNSTISREPRRNRDGKLYLLTKAQQMYSKRRKSCRPRKHLDENGLLREYFPKGKGLSDIPDSYVQEKFDELNKRPRKCLGYKTPFKVYHSQSLHLA